MPSPFISGPHSERPLIIIGAGGHAKVLIEALRRLDREILGVTDPSLSKSQDFFGVPVLGNDIEILNYPPSAVELVNGLGAIPGKTLRWKINAEMEGKGFTFAQVIHPAATISADATLASGVQIMAGVVLQPSVTIGSSCIINTGATIDHDCKIGKYCHIAPGVTLSGSVHIGDNVHVGTGSSVIQDVSIATGAIIAAGSIVYKNIGGNVSYVQQRKEVLNQLP